MSGPTVSIIMCTYNGAAFIDDALDDLVAQTFTDWELVVSDDASSDDTVDRVRARADPRIRIVVQGRNLGYVANKNSAFSLARGTWLTQLDQDDRCAPERLERQVAALERTGLQICATGYWRLGLDGKPRGRVGPSTEIVLRNKGQREFPFWFPSIMASREVHSAIGEYPLYFAGAFGDDLYWTFKANARYPIICLPQPLYTYRESPGSITSTLDNPRKLMMGGMLRHLIEQRSATGSDDLERGNLCALAAAEERILSDSSYLAEQYRAFAARSIDQRRLADARRLIMKAGRARPFSLSLLRTAAYYFRTALSRA